MATINRIKYKQSGKYINCLSLGCQFLILSHYIQNQYFESNFIIIKMGKSKQQQDQKNRKLSQKGSDSDSQDSEEEQPQEEGYQSDFVNDDEDEDYDYFRPPRLNDEEFGKKQKKRKKKQDKQKEKNKTFNKIRHLGRDSDDDYDADDLDLIEEYDNKNKKLKRLKKRKQDQQGEQQEGEKQKWDDVGEEDFDDGGEGYGYAGSQQDNYEKEDQVVDEYRHVRELDDIYEPGDLLDRYHDATDKEIMDLDLPEREIIEILNVARATGKPIQNVKKQFELEDRSLEARWIYEKLRILNYLENNEDRACKEAIFNVLMMMHREHLQIMHIYYYRKKRYSNVLNLELLWKIQEYDEQWASFKSQSNKIVSTFYNALSGIQQPSKSLSQMLANCNDARILKYFKQYQKFLFSKMGRALEIGKKEKKSKISELIKQVTQRGVAKWLQESQIFLSPPNLALNLRQRQKIKKPRTPFALPKQQIENIFKNSDDQIDMRYPLLAEQNRIHSICKYLEYELFSYPQLRKILKDKYFKKLVISTAPTKQGQQDINLYSNYFPVKRIRQKPVTTLKRDVWILACEAQKIGLIKVDMRFQWQLSSTENKNFQNDTVYMDLAKNYLDINVNQTGDIWNLFRKSVLTGMLQSMFFPAFLKQVRDDLTREGHKDITAVCCNKLRAQLMKGPSLKNQQRPTKILSMVLQSQKMGLAFIDEHGQAHSPGTFILQSDDDIKRFVKDQVLKSYVEDNKPDLILIAANCRKAQTLRQTLRKQLNQFTQPVFCCYGQYQVSSLMAKKQILKGASEDRVVLQAISMARMKQNPIAQILSLWDQKIVHNAVLEMNLHPLQKAIPQIKLRDALQKVAIQAVNLIGLEINSVKQHVHFQSQLQFLCGLGPRKAFAFLQKIKQSGQIFQRKMINQFVSGPTVYKNCAPFFKIETSTHKGVLQRDAKDRKKNKGLQNEINLLDMTRIPDQWYRLTEKMLLNTIGQVNILALQQKKEYAGLKDQTICIIECFKHTQKMRNAQCDRKAQDYFNYFFDQDLVRGQIMNRFKNPRQPERTMQDRETFYSLLRETPQTLKRYMIFTVKVLSFTQTFLNVVISQNGLFGYIRLHHESQKKYEKGDYIKALILSFPFDQKKYQKYSQDQQQLLKVEMGLKFPHKSEDSGHDCFAVCFPPIVKQIHPLIDLQKDRFELRKEDRPVIEVKQEIVPRVKTEYRRISHPKYKNMNSASAVAYIKGQPIGQFVIRPSSQGPDFLVITWHFYKDVVAHIKIKTEAKNPSNPNIAYKIIDQSSRQKLFPTLDDILDKHIKPMNAIVQDTISNKKFLTISLEQIEEKAKSEMARDPSHIHYFFGCDPEYPQFIILIHIYRDKKTVKELIKVRSSGLAFHQQEFVNIKELILWFKQHFKQKEYQRYAKNTAIKK